MSKNAIFQTIFKTNCKFQNHILPCAFLFTSYGLSYQNKILMINIHEIVNGLELLSKHSCTLDDSLTDIISDIVKKTNNLSAFLKHDGFATNHRRDCFYRDNFSVIKLLQ